MHKRSFKGEVIVAKRVLQYLHIKKKNDDLTGKYPCKLMHHYYFYMSAKLVGQKYQKRKINKIQQDTAIYSNYKINCNVHVIDGVSYL